MCHAAAKKILDLAVQIEEKGKEFYKNLADYVEDEKQRDLFLYLAMEEEKHMDVFTHMSNRIREEEAPGEEPDVYFDFLEDFRDNSVFDPGCLEEKLAMESDFESTLALAMQRELHSIAFYKQLKEYLEDGQHEILEKIIKEERQHYMKLAEVKEILCAV